MKRSHFLLSAFFLLLLPLLLVGCLKAGETAPQVGPRKDNAPAANRTTCGEIFGSAFRSAEERAWYTENCSRWPLVNVPQSPSQGGGSATLPPECAAMQGKPYTSDQQRQWYLQHCLGGPATGTTAGAPQEGDRNNCDAIRGTPYRSNAERDWFLKNCPATTAGTTATSQEPDRTSCDAIRGTAYRSDAERNWFLRNCSGTTTTQPGTTNVVTQPSAGNSGRGNSNSRGGRDD